MVKPASTFRSHHHKYEFGASAVPVVVILLLIVGIVFFYANRSLIFEQRTSNNQYRYTQAQETAEMGLEWALAQLNDQTNIDAKCTPGGTLGTFRSRYIKSDIVNDVLQPVISGLQAGCVMVTDISGNTTPDCSCPSSGTVNLSTPDKGPYFTIEFKTVQDAGGINIKGGVIQVISRGCTASSSSSPDIYCVAANSSKSVSEGHATVSTQFAIMSDVGTSPAATITARGAVAMQGTGAGVGVYNPDASVNGITIDSGGLVDTEKARLVTVPGSSPESSVIQNDPALQVTGDQLFNSIFNMSKSQYKNGSAVKVLSCGEGVPATNCTITNDQLVAAYSNGARSIWIEGDLEIRANTQIGGITGTSPNQVYDPVDIVVNGSAKFSGTAEMIGFIYVIKDWNYTGGGGGFIRGAAVTEGSFNSTNGTPDFYYDGNVFKPTPSGPRGTYIRVPGSWIDKEQ